MGTLSSSLINSYSLSILMVIGLITLILGMVMIKEVKHTEVKTEKMGILSFAFIPLFVTSILVVISFSSLQFNLDTSLIVVMGLAIFTVISYFLLNRVLSLKKPFSFFSILNFFLGSVAIVLCLIVPNVVIRFNNQMGGIEIASPTLLGFFLVGFIILLVVGLFITKRKNILIK
jgi:predicted transporter